jgi:hypothetical protein
LKSLPSKKKNMSKSLQQVSRCLAIVLIAVFGCGTRAKTLTRPAASSFFVRANPKQATPHWVPAGDGMLISVTALFDDSPRATLSPNGKYYSLTSSSSQISVGEVGKPATELAVGRIVAWAGEQTLFFVGNDGFMRADFNRGLAVTPVKISTENLNYVSAVARNRKLMLIYRSEDNSAPSTSLYDVATQVVTKLVSTNDSKQFVSFDDDGTPTIALAKEQNGIEVFQALAGGWKQALGGPKHILEIDAASQNEVLAVTQKGDQQLEDKTSAERNCVRWNLTTGVVIEVASDCKASLVADDSTRYIAVMSSGVWKSTDAQYSSLTQLLNKLRISSASMTGATTGIAQSASSYGAQVYAFSLVTGEFVELLPTVVANTHPAPTLKKLSDKSDVVYLEGTAPIHGVIYNEMFQSNRDLEFWASRGYHVILTGKLDEELAEQGKKRFGDLPFALLGDVVQWPSLRPAAVIHDSLSRIDTPHASKVAPTLTILSGPIMEQEWRPEGSLFSVSQLIREALLSSKDPSAQTVVVSEEGGSRFRRVKLGLIDAYLAQHLGGRSESLPPPLLLQSKFSVAWGKQQFSMLANAAELPNDEMSPAEVSSLNTELAAKLTEIQKISSVAKCQVRLAEIRWSEAATRLREKLATAVALKHFQVKVEETLQQSRCSATLDNVDDAVSSVVKPMKPQ